MRTNCLERAGHILILIIWIEKRLVDLLIFKQNPRVLIYFQKNGKSTKLGKLRKYYWQQSFSFIIQEFIKSFPNLPSNWELLLNDLNSKRDAISHGHVSIYREFILYQPALNRKDLPKKIKTIRRAIPERISKIRLFRIRFDDKNYQMMMNAIEEFDTKLFPELSAEIGLKYDSIR